MDIDAFACHPCGVNGGEVVDVEGVQSDEEAENGERRTVKIQDPSMPTRAAREEHEKTHLPFRSWCRHCVRGKGKEMPHQTKQDEGDGNEMSFDFYFLGDEDGSRPIPTLMAIDRRSKMKMCSPVPSKSTGEYIAKRVLAFMKEVGCKHGDMVVKSDQEPAIVTTWTR